MKGKFSSMWRIAIAMVLVLSFSLIPAVAMGQGTDTYAGYRLGQTGTNTAEWVTTPAPQVGKYSVKLVYKDTDTTYVEFIPQPGITMADLDSIVEEWSFWYHMVTLTSGGPNMELRFTSAGYDPITGAGHVDINVQVVPGFTADVWAEENAVTNAGVYYYGNDPVDGTAFSWEEEGTTTLGGVLTLIDAESAMGTDSAADWQLTRVRMEIGWGGAERTCYIDDVTIDGVTYTMEPMVLDAAYYKKADTVTVNVFNGFANDPMAIDTLTITAKSTTDSVGDSSIVLTETGADTGIFSGVVNLIAAAPANRALDQIVVSAGDTVTVEGATGSQDWGVGAQAGVIVTATVDGTAPVISIVSPAASSNITDATPEIKASFTEGGSGVDTDSVVLKLDTVDKTSDATVVADSVTYTPSASISEGSHTVTVDVSDLVGNAATQKSWSFKVDTIDPVITGQVATPAVMAPSVSTNITFTASVADGILGSGINTVKINLSSIGGSGTQAMLDGGVAPDVTAGDGIYTAKYAATVVTQAIYTLTVTATDYATNTATKDITLVVSSDTVPPVITSPTLTYKYGSSVPPGDTVTISANVTDNVGMGTVTAASDAFDADANLLDDGNAPDTTAGDDVYTGTATVKTDAAKGSYTITITATDVKSNEATNTSLTLTVVSGATGYALDLVDGWNLISLPLIPDSDNISEIISTDTLASANVSSIGIIRAYDPATGGFPYYIPETGSGDLAVMEDGLGYWVFMEEADTLTITGRQWPVPPAVPPSYDVVVGWNLIGFKSLTDDDDANYLANIIGTYPVVWSYDAVAGAYSNVKGVGFGMEVGHGFWIWITEAGTIVPPG